MSNVHVPACTDGMTLIFISLIYTALERTNQARVMKRTYSSRCGQIVTVDSVVTLEQTDIVSKGESSLQAFKDSRSLVFHC